MIIRCHGAIPAPLNYEGFPKSVCTSINEVVCHGIPNEFDVLEEGDIINVDVSTILDGYYSDASRMFVIGQTTPEKQKLVDVARECLEIGMKAARPFGFVGGYRKCHRKACQEERFQHRARFVRPWGGTEFHEEPDVEHFGRKGTGCSWCPAWCLR